MKRGTRIALWINIAILLTALWSASGTLDNADAGIRARVTRQLLSQGQLVIESPGGPDQPALYRDEQGTYSARFGLGQSLYFLPFMAVAQAVVSPLPFPPEQRARIETVIFSVPVLGSVLALNFWLCATLCHQLKADRITAYGIAGVATFGSSFWQMAKQAQEEVQLSLLLLAALISFIHWLRKESPIYAWISAAFAGIGLIFRPTAITIFSGIIGLFVYEVLLGNKRNRIKQIMFPLGIASAVTVAAAAGFNFYKTGDPLNPGYDLEGWFTGDWLTGLIEPVFGLDRGIIVTNLWLLPCVGITIVGWRYLTHELKVMAILCGYLMISSVSIYARCCWAGDMTYGARYQTHLVPLLGVTFLLSLISILNRAIRGSSFRKIIGKRARSVWISLCLIFMLLQIPSIAFIHHLEIQQALIAGEPGVNQSLTGRLGQVRLRYANFLSKVSQGDVVQLSSSAMTPEQTQILADASRWNFWPWLAAKHIPHSGFQVLKVLWGVILLGSWVCWGIALLS